MDRGASSIPAPPSASDGSTRSEDDSESCPAAERELDGRDRAPRPERPLHSDHHDEVPAHRVPRRTSDGESPPAIEPAREFTEGVEEEAGDRLDALHTDDAVAATHDPGRGMDADPGIVPRPHIDTEASRDSRGRGRRHLDAALQLWQGRRAVRTGGLREETGGGETHREDPAREVPGRATPLVDAPGHDVRPRTIPSTRREASNQRRAAPCRLIGVTRPSACG